MKLDLDVAQAKDVADILRRAADAYAESAQDCVANWQDKNCGRAWTRIAGVLETAAVRIEQIVNQEGLA